MLYQVKVITQIFLLQYLKGLNVQLKNPVLPQHEIETTAGSRSPKNEEIERFKQITFIKKGCYDSVEDKIITNNWKEFCKVRSKNIIFS